MEKIASFSVRLASKHRFCINRRQLLEWTTCSRTLTKWSAISRERVFVQCRLLGVQRYHASASFQKKDLPVCSFIKLGNKRFFSRNNSTNDPEELSRIQEGFVKQKDRFKTSLESPLSLVDDDKDVNEIIENSVTGISSQYNIGNDKISSSANEHGQFMSMRSKASEYPTGKQTASAYNDDDSDETVSSDDEVSDESSSSESDSDSSGTDIDDSTDEEGSGLPKLPISEESSETASKELDELPKVGFTADEMIEHLESSVNDNDNADEKFMSDSDGDIVTDQCVDENVDELDKYSANDTAIGEKDLSAPVSDMTYTAPSRHFDESGVISLVDMKKDQSKGREWSVEEIEDFVNITEIEKEEPAWQPAVSLDRGTEGVFDIEDLVMLIKHENVDHVVTISMPPEKNFGDYMVIGTAKSMRHLRSVSENINWIYKRRKRESERYVRQEGYKQDCEWIALDLGNIILHLFLEGERELYDLETLWTVGSQFDEKSLEQDDPYALSIDDHPWLKELEDIQRTKYDTKDEPLLFPK